MGQSLTIICTTLLRLQRPLIIVIIIININITNHIIPTQRFPAKVLRTRLLVQTGQEEELVVVVFTRLRQELQQNTIMITQVLIS